MFLDTSFWAQVMFILGEIIILAVATFLVLTVFMMAITFFSIRNGRFYFPRLLKSGFTFMEGVVKATCKLAGLDDKDLGVFFIKLHNKMNFEAFKEIPVEKRAIFLPQCLRSSKCPANLTPEGLECINCGRCEIGPSITKVREMGYQIFIVPGSTFLKRMVKQYHPKAIIGVGCIMEVKEGLEMCDKIGLIGMGVVNLRDGCVETLADWNEIMETASLGLEDIHSAS